MRKYVISIVAASAAIASAFPAAAQSYRSAARAQKGRPASRHESNFYIKGPNAPFKNQLRKLSDPLNANGAK